MGSPIDLLPFLARVMEQNTRSYRSDFDFDVGTLTKASYALNREDRIFYWMSRPTGTWCVKEREVFLRETVAYSIWTHYADTPEGIKAYRVTVTGQREGRVVGLVHPLDYKEQVRRVQRDALPTVSMTIQYEDGHTITVPCQDDPKGIATILPGHGGVRHIRYAPENEAELQEAIEALTGGKTIIMIAHRLKTVRNADQILVLDHGEIVQHGTHDQLIGQQGIYADFILNRRAAIDWKINS